MKDILIIIVLFSLLTTSFPTLADSKGKDWDERQRENQKDRNERQRENQKDRNERQRENQKDRNEWRKDRY